MSGGIATKLPLEKHHCLGQVQIMEELRNSSKEHREVCGS